LGLATRTGDVGRRRARQDRGRPAAAWVDLMERSEIEHRPGDSDAQARTEVSGPDAGDRPTIAVINDDSDFLDLMHDLLEESEGYRVLVCKEGNHAYAFVKELVPDLVILDIRIGHQESGWTILELLTLDPRTRPIPVIVCSAAITDLQAHQPMLDALGVEVLAKPFDLEMLLEKVNTSLGRRRGFEER